MNCSPKPSGRSVYNYLDDNPRIFCPIARGFDEWNRLYNKRPSTERCNDRIKNDFNEKMHVSSLLKPGLSGFLWVLFACI